MSRELKPSDPLLSQTELAEELSLSPRTLERWRTVGEGPKFIKLGSGSRGGSGAIRYRRSDVDSWLQKCERVSTSDPD